VRAERLFDGKTGLRRIILMSDGEDEQKVNAIKKAHELHAKDIVIDTVAFGHSADREFLKALAGAKGTMVEGNDAATLKQQFLALEAGTRGLLGSGR
jgi:hypothetical protein